VSIARRGGRGRAAAGSIACVASQGDVSQRARLAQYGRERERASAQGRQRAARVIYVRRNLAPPEKYMCARYQMRRSQKAPYITRQSHTNLTQSHGISANFTTTLFSYQSFRPLRDSPRLELASVFWVSQFISADFTVLVAKERGFRAQEKHSTQTFKVSWLRRVLYNTAAALIRGNAVLDLFLEYGTVTLE